MEALAALTRELATPLNFEMAVTDEMIELALRLRPHAVCLVPEKREERTTEGGLDVVGLHNTVAPATRRLIEAGIRVSLFVQADPDQLQASQHAGAAVVELHTGAYCDAVREGRADEANVLLDALRRGATDAAARGLEVHAGHGIDFETVTPIAAIPELCELNIGHFLIGEAVFTGLDDAVRRMRALINAARCRPSSGRRMIVGIGSDLTDIRRIEAALARFGERFTQRSFTDVERDRSERKGGAAEGARPATPSASRARRLAPRRSARACAGACSCATWGVVNARSGQPTMRLTGGAATRLAELTPPGHEAVIHLSLTDDHPYAQRSS
jgi:pyridoxine 5-phosphate synthase